MMKPPEGREVSARLNRRLMGEIAMPGKKKSGTVKGESKGKGKGLPSVKSPGDVNGPKGHNTGVPKGDIQPTR